MNPWFHFSDLTCSTFSKERKAMESSTESCSSVYTRPQSRSPFEAPTSRRNSSITLIPYNSIQFLGITHLSLGHALISLVILFQKSTKIYSKFKGVDIHWQAGGLLMHIAAPWCEARSWQTSPQLFIGSTSPCKTDCTTFLEKILAKIQEFLAANFPECLTCCLHKDKTHHMSSVKTQ